MDMGPWQISRAPFKLIGKWAVRLVGSRCVRGVREWESFAESAWWPRHGTILGIANGFWIWACAPFAYWAEPMYNYTTHVFPVYGIFREQTEHLSSFFRSINCSSSSSRSLVVVWFQSQCFFAYDAKKNASMPIHVTLPLTNEIFIKHKLN